MDKIKPKLDKWDFELIRAIKQNSDCMTKCYEIWGQRCKIETEHLKLSDINNYLCDLALHMGIIDVQFIFNLNPECNWKFTNETQNFQQILFSRLVSLFRVLKIDEIPGYEKYFNLTT